MSRCLHHNTLGCIAQCPGRCCLHLYFGNVGLRLLPHELRQWRGLVAELCTYHASHIVDAEEEGEERVFRRPGYIVGMRAITRDELGLHLVDK